MGARQRRHRHRGGPPTLAQTVENQHDKVDPNVFMEQVENLVKAGDLVAWPATAFDESGRPDPEQAYLRETVPPTGLRQEGIRVIPYHVARERGWVTEKPVAERNYPLTDEGRIKEVLNLLAGTALKGSETEVRQLQVGGQAGDGARFQMTFIQTTVGALVESRALFSELATRIRFNGPLGQLVIRLGHTEPGCRFAQALDSMKD
ncbi:MAG: hypothetical protein U5L11_10675 [Arhodomonas sp.]|nr:hypothetical protein [Arhodomonas sp.]